MDDAIVRITEIQAE